jgi:RNA polymerase sigma factor (sigma-70 family)
LELEGLLPQHEWTVNDLLDELLVRAWKQFAERPKHVELDVWLMDLLHEILADWTKEGAAKSLEEEIPVPESEEDWWEEPLGYKEELRLEDLVPDQRDSPAWEELSAKEQHEQLLTWLSQLPAPQRQAFLLHVLEDYQPFEIAMILDRSEEQVRQDIEHVRRYLIECLQAKGYLASQSQSSN